MINEGSAKAYCSEAIDLIENYDEAINDDSSTWDLHHRRELTEDGEFAYSREDLKKLKLYYNRPADELIFLTKSEHKSLHSKAKALSSETRKKLSESQKGSKNPFFGKKHTAATRQRMSDANKGKIYTAETRQKISDSKKGQIPWNKGKKLSAETRAKISATLKRRKARKLAEEK